jgi:catechol 2,3-dioxygenase-like lactoylglutathione lyase family enzyme
MRAWSAGLAAAGLLAGAATAQERPPIAGISHLAVYAADPAASERFYASKLGGVKAPDPEDPHGARYFFGPRQFVEVLPLPADQGASRLAHVAFVTTDAAAMRRWLLAHGARDVSAVASAPGGERRVSARDPEGNLVQFVQPGRYATTGADAISDHAIHVGFLVRSRAAEDRFYRDILGFRPYWRGAMRDGAVDWVSQQVPDGRDWLEYMLVGPGSTVPLDHVDANELGVLNHISLGVPNMEAAVTTLIKGDRLSPRHDGPQMGKDGKWQANLYDPDGTRVELMEFQPVTTPCCSPFTAPSPTR